MANLNDLKALRETQVARAHSLKTKKAQSKAWDLVHETECAMEQLHRAYWTQFEGQRFIGTALMSGTDILIETQFGTLQAYACNDVLAKSWYEQTCCVSFERGQQLEFTLWLQDCSWRGMVAGCKDISGGTLDESRYAELSSKPGLAFFKYPTGMTGLFAQTERQS